ncbi:chaperone BCS1 [Hyphodiscus hymeniophilus]|uniref:Chaperone BCS1 n=1 Tax=Hyphodiscus hymeniophilus TaxID=353542 RepID=A0A9P7AXY9_9HELO|nr:chaperone BCS1 [Hyphodiscus hymeniophilus]
MTDPTKTAKPFLPLDTLFENPVFAGGIGLAGLGVAAQIGRKSVIRGASLIKQRLLVNLEISKQDPSYPWILQWLARPRASNSIITNSLTRIHHLSMRTIQSKASQSGPAHTKFSLEPGFGKQIIQHKNAYISVSREKSATAVHLTTGEPHETVTFTTLYAFRHIFEDIFDEAYRMAQKAQEGKTIMYKGSMGWTPLGEARRKRPLHSVILDEGVKERIVDDVKEFLRSRQWYVDRGIPYRRGYLLYGQPGSGKSSFIQALAGELDFGIALVNLSERGITDDKLGALFTSLPPRTLILLEDADAAFSNRRQVGSDGYSGSTVTFSGLLNALDGVAAGEERIAFLTTNHIERLDPALIRPGRVDMTVRIGEATRYQAAEMWKRFYGDIDEDEKGQETFLQRLEGLGLVAFGEKPAKSKISTAAIQGLFQFNKDNMDGAIGMVEGLIPKRYEPESQESEGIKVAPS